MRHRDKCERNVAAWDRDLRRIWMPRMSVFYKGCFPGLIRQQRLVQRWLDQQSLQYHNIIPNPEKKKADNSRMKLLSHYYINI